MKNVASRKVLILCRFCVTRRALSSTLGIFPILKMRLLCVTRSLTIMPGKGLEPQGFLHQILSLARLPIPPSGQC